VASATPLANPLKLVEAAVAGEDLLGVARGAAAALGRGVVITMPAFGAPVVWPQEAAEPEAVDQLLRYAKALAADQPTDLPAPFAQATAVHLGQGVVGVVAALPGPELDSLAWLEGAAAAAAVTALMRDATGFDPRSARRGFLQMLELDPPGDLGALVAHARRLGYDFSAGAVGLCALAEEPVVDWDAIDPVGLVADVGGGRLLGLVPLGADSGGESAAGELVAALEAAGIAAVASGPRRGPGDLADLLREASILLELATDDGALFGFQEDTYRLLVGVMLHDPEELTDLRERTVAELERYDAIHDTELLATLEGFLAHHGSTTETAEAMGLHRHTVGYRLARVQEVAGLSPYESDGRERLSLGLKAHRIIAADARLATPTRP
jgi:PucR family transcriptional regulator, purine catabolism regulatory protein